MSDADRALGGRERRRTPPRGVEFDEERTPPPTDIEELAHRLWPLRNMQDQVLALSTQVTRVEGRADRLEELAGGLDDIGRHVAEDTVVHLKITETLADIHGASGNNGKLGELRRRVDTLTSKAWWLITAAVGGFGAAAIKVVLIVRAFDAVEASAEASARHIQLLEAQVQILQTALIVHHPDLGKP